MKKKFYVIGFALSLLIVIGCVLLQEKKKNTTKIEIESMIVEKETIAQQLLLMNNPLLEVNISNEVATFNIAENETTTETETVETETKKVAKRKKSKKNNNKRNKKTNKNEWNYLGEFKITFYCPCSKCCGVYANGVTATGNTAKAYRTIAVDPNVISYFSKVKIDGLDGYEFVAEDTGGAIHGNKIDVFVNDHQTALNYGVMYTSVYKKGD